MANASTKVDAQGVATTKVDAKVRKQFPRRTRDADFEPGPAAR
jgi:hypothetical protein